MKSAISAALAIGAACLGISAWAQDYPSKQIRIIVPFAAGGATDSLARQIGQYMSGRFNQSAIVDNRPGGGTVIAAQALGTSKPDGYTFAVFEPSTVSINPYLFKRPPYDAEKTILPVTKLVDIPEGIVVPPGSTINNLKDFVAYAKAHPGTAFGTPGPTSPTYLSFTRFLDIAGVTMTHTGYRGSAPAMGDLMGNQLPAAVLDFSSTLNNIKAGKLKPIAVGTSKRLELLPDVPTYGEFGYKDYELVPWFGVFVPGGTPRPVVERLNQILHEMATTKEFGEWVRSRTLVPALSKTPDEFAAVIKSDGKIYAQIIQKLGLSLE